MDPPGPKGYRRKILKRAKGFVNLIRQNPDLFKISEDDVWVYLPGTDPFSDSSAKRGERMVLPCRDFTKSGFCWRYTRCKFSHDPLTVTKFDPPDD